MIHWRINSHFLLFVTSIIAFWMCRQSPEKKEQKQPALQQYRGDNQIDASNSNLNSIKVGRVIVWAELVQTPKEQEQGLMFREHLPENHGMLFVYPYPQVLSFWMRNTFIPLDI